MTISDDLKWTLESVDLSKNIDGVMHHSDQLRTKLAILNQTAVKATIYKRVNSLVDVFNELSSKAQAKTPQGQDLYHTILVSPHTHMMMRMVFGGMPTLSVRGISIRPSIIFGGEVARIQYALVENSIVASLTRAGFMCDAMATGWFEEHALPEDFDPKVLMIEVLMIEDKSASQIIGT